MVLPGLGFAVRSTYARHPDPHQEHRRPDYVFRPSQQIGSGFFRPPEHVREEGSLFTSGVEPARSVIFSGVISAPQAPVFPLAGLLEEPSSREPNTRQPKVGESSTRGSFQRESNTRGSFQRESNTRGSFQRESTTRGSFQRESNTRRSYEGETSTRGSYQTESSTRGRGRRPDFPQIQPEQQVEQVIPGKIVTRGMGRLLRVKLKMSGLSYKGS